MILMEEDEVVGAAVVDSVSLSLSVGVFAMVRCAGA